MTDYGQILIHRLVYMKQKTLTFHNCSSFRVHAGFFPFTVATPMTLDVISSFTVNIFVNKVLTASLTDLDLSAANFKASYK